MNDQFEFSGGLKKLSFALIGVGILGLILQFLVYDSASRIWANVLLNNVFFLGIALVGVFFIAASTLANAGWYVMVRRIPEAMMAFIPYVFPLMLITFLVGGHDLYEWTHEYLYEEGGDRYDPILAGKQGYLNTPFFLIRMVLYFALWTGLAMLIRKVSLKEDIDGGTTNFKKGGIYAALFIVVFGITSSTSSWDWTMSIDPHWYSTLWGWYNFASMFVSGLCVITLIILFLKSKGYMPQLNNEHLHDLGKFIFAFSIFWTYLWFSQFMLIWYANIPEETVYFYTRFQDYKFFFFLNLVINFFFPFLALMTRSAKRQTVAMAFVATIVLLGHWLDFYLMIFPGVGEHIVGHAAGVHVVFTPNPLDLLLTLGYAGLFMFVMFTALAKAPLVPKNHPYLEESITHQT